MSVHCSLEALSSYVDAELSPDERGVVESHVRDCPECRLRLRHLEKVVEQVRRLEEASPPPTLGYEVARRIRVERGTVPWSSKLEDGLGRLARQPLFAPLFALIIAFGAISYLLSVGVARHTASSTRVVIGQGPAAAVASGEAEARAKEETVTGPRSDLSENVGESEAPAGGPEDRARARRQAADRSGELKEQLQVVPPRAGEVSLGTQAARVEVEEEVLEIAGRRLLLREGVWVEEGVGARRPTAVIDLSTGDPLPAELEPLRGTVGRFWILVAGARAGDGSGVQVVEIRIPSEL